MVFPAQVASYTTQTLVHTYSTNFSNLAAPKENTEIGRLQDLSNEPTCPLGDIGIGEAIDFS